MGILAWNGLKVLQFNVKKIDLLTLGTEETISDVKPREFSTFCIFTGGY